MSEPTGRNGEHQPSRPEGPVSASAGPSEPSEPWVAPPAEPRFSLFVTGLAALVLLGGFLLFGWLQVNVPQLDRVAKPEQALQLMVGREMDLQDALARAPAWQRRLYELLSSSSESERILAIAWYDELAAYSNQPSVQLELAILEAESGRLERVKWKAGKWAARPDPFPAFARLLTAGYLESRLDPADEATLQAELAKALPAGWFADKLAANLAARAGDRARLVEAEGTLADRGEWILRRAYELTLVQLGGLLVGAAALLLLARRRKDRSVWRIGTAPVPPLWRGRVGALVLLRGGAVGMVVMLGLLSFEEDSVLLRVLSIPLTNLPLLMLAHRYLWSQGPHRGANRDHGFMESLGLRLVPAAWSRLGLVVLAALAAGFVGEWALEKVAEALNLSSHWTEWFDGDLVWGGRLIVGVSMLEYVLFAPLFEELVFRGLLFATLRRKFGFGLSAILSAAIFAVAHGYGLLGFVSVIWSGLIWSWIYEKTGSLLPGMVAHASNNLMVCLTIMWLLR